MQSTPAGCIYNKLMLNTDFYGKLWQNITIIKYLNSYKTKKVKVIKEI